MPYDTFLDPLPTAEEMRRWDEESVRLGIPGIMLMENAAQAALRVLLSYIPDLKGKKTAVLMGGGNNGGDAVCLARLMNDMGADVTVFHLPALEKIQGDALFHLELAKKCELSFRPAALFDADCDILIDGLLGTGFSGTLRQNCQDIIALCNQKKKYREFTLALDIPSGLDCNNGTPGPCAIMADATATFAAAKPGLVMPCAKQYTGTLHVAYIGTPKKARITPGLYLLSEKMLRHLPPVLSGGYKNTYGHVVIIGGAHGMGGAAHIAALAALKSGCGLVTVVTPLSWTDSVRLGHPEIMTFGLDSHDCRNSGKTEAYSSTDWPDCVPERLKELIEKADSFVIGPGMGRGEDARNFVAACLNTLPGKPVVIDADALHFLPQLDGILKDDRHIVLTPHSGEARALLEGACGSHLDSPADTLHAICTRYRCTVVLKGAGTWVTGRDLPDAFYPYDIPQLSMGGSGDCLAGLCGSLLAQNARKDMSQDLDRMLTLSAMESVAWHGTAGRLLQKKYPERGCLSSDLVNMLPEVRRLLSEVKLEKVLGKVFEKC